MLKYHAENNERLKKDKEELIKKNNTLKNHLETVKTQIQELEVKGLSNVDIIKRLNKLEEKGKTN